MVYVRGHRRRGTRGVRAHIRRKPRRKRRKDYYITERELRKAIEIYLGVRRRKRRKRRKRIKIG